MHGETKRKQARSRARCTATGALATSRLLREDRASDRHASRAEDLMQGSRNSKASLAWQSAYSCLAFRHLLAHETTLTRPALNTDTAQAHRPS
eukprot:6198472-Pleurochrysis_carterae.AAC.2